MKKLKILHIKTVNLSCWRGVCFSTQHQPTLLFSLNRKIDYLNLELLMYMDQDLEQVLG